MGEVTNTAGCSLASFCVVLVLNYFIVEEALRRGELVEVLHPYTGRKARFSLLHPGGQGQSLAARLFADMLVERCARRGQTTASQSARVRRK